MAKTLSYTESLTVTHCHCGIAVAIPDNLFRQAYDNGATVYCPLGHTFGWWETEADKLRKKLEKEQNDRQWYAQRMRAERELREDTERRLSAQKGVNTKLKKRAKAGVCPCCNRTFQQLARHMKTQHPDFDPKDAT